MLSPLENWLESNMLNAKEIIKKKINNLSIVHFCLSKYSFFFFFFDILTHTLYFEGKNISFIHCSFLFWWI